MIRQNLILIAFIIFLIAYLIFGDYGILSYIRLVKIKHNYEQQIVEMDKKIKELKKEVEFLQKDKDYLEMIIRKELNLKKPNEDLFILDDNISDKK
ncbi:cell division protein FtsB [Deferribacter desulfuricans SSM1]|uniref:Cell division protein FtsB n=1 Tax=Deferribacter desulfuricans (strain DSM 14783 / JCM 11476 / NBRC 101012 / SSM1) TaxID=639282 RepID=D3PD85_DEFDS|nr:septum formation initiator family protein [Deferribacter desulfuricans]BAI80558.1 cell division protein FtsB [Deferribacter desulfuricans SSM1]